METIEMLINDLESEILKAKSAAFSRTDVVVNKGIMLDLLSRIRENYPMALKNAAEIMAKRDEYMDKAKAYAEDIMNKAEEEAQKMVSESEILNQAQLAAQKLQNDTSLSCDNINYETRKIEFELISKVEDSLKGLLAETIAKVQAHKNDLRYKPFV